MTCNAFKESCSVILNAKKYHKCKAHYARRAAFLHLKTTETRHRSKEETEREMCEPGAESGDDVCFTRRFPAKIEIMYSNQGGAKDSSARGDFLCI